MYMRRGNSNDDGWGTVYQGLAFLGNAMRQGQAIGTERRRREEEDGLNNAYTYIAGKIGNQGDVSLLDGDPILNTRQGTQALGMFMTDRANTETSRLKMLKTLDAANDHYYQNTIRPLAFAAQEAFKAGDLQRFGQVAGELSSKAPYPYRLIPGQDGNFDVEFRSDKAGGWSRTGERVAPQQVMGEIDKLMAGEQHVLAGANMQARPVNQRYLASAARYQMSTILGNAQNMANPESWIPLRKGDKVIYAIPQNRHDNYAVGPSFRVLEDGKASFMVEGLDELVKQGYQPVVGGKGRVGTGRGKKAPSDIFNTKEGKELYHRMLLQAGYAYDKDQKWYYRTDGVDDEGKLRFNYSKPATEEVLMGIRNIITGKIKRKGDELRVFQQQQEATPQNDKISQVNKEISNPNSNIKPPVTPPKGSPWENFPKKYREYYEFYKEKPDNLDPYEAIEKLTKERHEKVKRDMDKTNTWEQDMTELANGKTIKGVKDWFIDKF